MATIQNIQLTENLRTSNPKVNSNFTNINTQLVNHVAGTADKHNAQDIIYTGLQTGENVKSAIDNLKSDFNNLSFTGSEHDALVTSALIDYENEDFGPDGTATYLDGRLTKWEGKVSSHLADFVAHRVPVTAFGAHSITETGYENFDSTQSIRDAITFLDTMVVGKKELDFLNGTYLVGLNTGFDSAFFEPKSNISYVGTGATIKAKNNVGEQFNFFATNSYVENIVFDGITFDGNGQNNLVTSGQYHKHAALLLNSGYRNVEIKNCKFKNFAGDQILVFMRSASNPSRNIKIYNCEFENVSDAITGNTGSTDHSCIYASGENVFVHDNTFRNDNQSVKCTAFEAHGNNQYFYNNSVTNFSRVTNIAAQTSNGVNETIRGVYIENNTCYSVYSLCEFWSATGNSLDNIDILRNKIFAKKPDATKVVSSIIIARSNVAVGTLTNVSIDNNYFDYIDDISTVPYNVALINIANGSKIKIRNNTAIKGCGNAVAISVQYENMNFIEIKGNHFYDSTLNGSITSVKTAIQINNIWNTLKEVEIINNEIKNVSASSVDYAIAFSVDASTRIQNIKIIENDTNINIFPVLSISNVALTNLYINDTCNGTPENRIKSVLGSCFRDIVNGAVYRPRTNNEAIWTKTEYGSAAPTSGYHNAGDVLIITSPSAGGYSEYVCVTTGTPGTWKGRNQVQA